MNDRLTHLQMLQAVITRMNGNSFLLKGWSVTLVSALFALAAKDANWRFAALAYFPCIAFWLLDGFFLHQEKLFRKLYDAVRKEDSSVEAFSMNTDPFRKDVNPWIRVCFSKTLALFHLAIVLVILVVWVSLKQTPQG